MIFGAMSLGGAWDYTPLKKEDIIHSFAAIEAALEVGMTRFDHANIYKWGKAEEVFGLYLEEHKGLREKIELQSKVGIHVPTDGNHGYYDFSYDHVVSEVEKILKRLRTDYLDTLLFHRPDALVDRKEFKRAVDYLFDNGMVRNIGVSNMSQYQINLLENYTERHMVANQLEMSLKKRDWVESGFVINQQDAKGLDFENGTVEYCMLNNIEIQAWGPLAQGIYTGRNIEDTDEATKNTVALVAKLAEERNVSTEAIVLAWLMRHPANIVPVIGTSNPERIRYCGQAKDVTLTHQEWYQLLVAARGHMIP